MDSAVEALPLGPSSGCRLPSEFTAFDQQHVVYSAAREGKLSSQVSHRPAWLGVRRPPTQQTAELLPHFGAVFGRTSGSSRIPEAGYSKHTIVLPPFSDRAGCDA